MAKKKSKKIPYFVTGYPTHEHILYPWVDMSLGSNNRTQHRYKTKERAAAREAGDLIALDAGLHLEAAPIEMDFIICPPDRRTRDDDNILTAFKSTRDGIFKRLGINDRFIRKTTISWGEIDKGRGAIYVRLRNIPLSNFDNGKEKI